MSTFFTRSGASPPRRLPIKRAFSGLVGRFDATQEIPPRFIGRSLLQAIPIDTATLLDGRTDPPVKFTMTAAQIRTAKHDAKTREENIRKKMMQLVALAYPNEPQGKRDAIVREALACNPTAWDLNRLLKIFADSKIDGPMFASNVTNEDGSKVTNRPANESHRHPVLPLGVDVARIPAQEQVLGRYAQAGKEQNSNALELIANWRDEIHAVAAQILKDGGDLSMTGYTYMGVTMRLDWWLGFLELFPADDGDVTRQRIATFLDSGDNSSWSAEQGRRRHVAPKGPSLEKHEDSKEQQRGFKVLSGELGNLLLPEETTLGQELLEKGREVLREEKLRREVEAFYRRNKPVDLRPEACPACVMVGGVLYHCRLDASHRGVFKRFFDLENRVLGTDHSTFIPNPDPDNSYPVLYEFTDEGVGKLLEESKSEQDHPPQQDTDKIQ